MPNKNYLNGKAREHRIKSYLVDKGYLVVRSAGSKSPIDLIAIHPVDLHIYFIQAKPNSMSDNTKGNIEKTQQCLSNRFLGTFKCISHAKELNPLNDFKHIQGDNTNAGP